MLRSIINVPRKITRRYIIKYAGEIIMQDKNIANYNNIFELKTKNHVDCMYKLVFRNYIKSFNLSIDCYF